MTSVFSMKVNEFGTNRKPSSVTMYVPNLTAGTFTAEIGWANDLIAAIDAVTLGTLGRAEIGHQVAQGSEAAASSSLAQRENKWLVSAHESGGSGAPVSFTIPCADLTLLGPDGENMADGAAKSNLISAIEVFGMSRAGNTIVVDSIKFRGRTL